MTVTLKKAVLIAFVTGTLVPFLMEATWNRLDAMGIHPGIWWSNAAICAWPTGIVLMETSPNWQGYVAFAISVIINGMLYGVIVLFIGYLISTFRPGKDQTQGWWPS